MKDIEKLIKVAKQAVKFSYAPYSKFKVGAAVLTKKGKIYSGANIENASYGLTICAERVAIAKAVSEGEKQFTAIAIYTNTRNFTFPCGACLQVMSEFNPKLYIILINMKGEIRQYSLSSLLPHSFTPHLFLR
jgi:cytidine deaminase